LESIRNSYVRKGKEATEQIESLTKVVERLKSASPDFINNPTRIDLCNKHISELQSRKARLAEEVAKVDKSKATYLKDFESFDSACQANLDLVEIMNSERLIKEIDFLIDDLSQEFKSLSQRHNLGLEGFKEANETILAEIPARQEILTLGS